MTFPTLLTKIAAASTLALAALGAQAGTYDFVLTGDYTASWQLEASPVPDLSVADAGFVLQDVAGDFPGSYIGYVDITFYSDSRGGGIFINDFYGNTSLVVSDGPQLYTGTEDAPTFQVGSFKLTEYQGPGTYTLTITDVSAVPEASTVAMMLAGLGLVGGLAARRRQLAGEAAVAA